MDGFLENLLSGGRQDDDGAGDGGQAGTDQGAASGQQGQAAAGQGDKRFEEYFRKAEEEREALRAELQALKETTGKIAPVLGALAGDDDRRRESQHEAELRREWAQDPFAAMRKFQEEERRRIREEVEERVGRAVSPIVANATFDAARKKVDRDFDVDWDDPDVQRRVSAQLRSLSEKYKQDHPDLALLKAAHLAGALKEKATPPYMPGPGGSVPAAVAQKEADRYREEILGGKKSNVLDGFYSR